MRPSDVPEILELEEDVPGAWSKEHLEDELQQPTGFQFVVCNESSGKMLAVLCGRVMADEAEILKLTVVKNERGKGVGQFLLNFVLGYCRKRGVQNCFLELRASNTAARRLYEKSCFFIAGIRKGYYENPREDALLMQRQFKILKGGPGEEHKGPGY
jgi:ribosomal-protein-alanine N-acetyltransferase